MVASEQTLMTVTAQLPWAAHTLLDRPSHVHDRAAGSRAATAYGSQLAASLAGRGWSVISGRTEETDVLHAPDGYRYATVTSLTGRATLRRTRTSTRFATHCADGDRWWPG